ncbi:MAG: hypothetical protein ACOXZV_00660 [Bacteroidales bacterium]|jgi:hypothetical protein
MNRKTFLKKLSLGAACLAVSSKITPDTTKPKLKTTEPNIYDIVEKQKSINKQAILYPLKPNEIFKLKPERTPLDIITER